MKNVMVRDIDEQTFVWLEERAMREQRTVPGEIRYLLDQARSTERTREESAAAFERIVARRRHLPSMSENSTELLSEERER